MDNRSIAHGYQNKIKILKELHFPNSVGLLYSAFTFYLGFKVNSGEYKPMGLAPYGNENSVETKKFIKKIEENIVDIKRWIIFLISLISSTHLV